MSKLFSPYSWRVMLNVKQFVKELLAQCIFAQNAYSFSCYDSEAKLIMFSQYYDLN